MCSFNLSFVLIKGGARCGGTHLQLSEHLRVEAGGLQVPGSDKQEDPAYKTQMGLERCSAANGYSTVSAEDLGSVPTTYAG